MKYLIVVFITHFTWVTALNAQQWCGTDQYLQQYLNAEPQNRIQYENDRLAFAELVQNFAERSEEKKIIPVVFHVFWDNCDDNISLAQIEDGLRVVNEDFNKSNADTSSMREVFKPYAANSAVEFRLARKDPSGNLTDGVVRVESSATINAQNNVKSISSWPTNRYLNIWVVRSIYNFQGGGGTILGYAQFPGNGNNSSYGIVIRHDALGTIGTANADGRTLTHEIGHCLNLYHTFEGGCGGSCAFTGDDVCDTPPAADATYDCSTSTNTCSNDQSGASPYNSDVPDMIENYMSYNHNCQCMYTEGQKTRIRAALSNYNLLVNLTSESNLENAGVIGLQDADFYTDAEAVYQYARVTFKDVSRFDATSYNWDFGINALPTSSTSQTENVQFSTPGIQNISFQVSDGINTVSTTKPVFVVSEKGQFIPYFDNMEAVGGLPVDNWMSSNVDKDEYKWKSTNEAAYSGVRSLKMDAYGSCGYLSDVLLSRSFDFSNLTSFTLKFKTAFAKRADSNADFLRLYASTDHGQTWNLKWVKTALDLASAPNTDFAFIPTDSTEWKEWSLNINGPGFMLEGVIFKFEFVGRGGNNLYLDDFGITGSFKGEVILSAPQNGKAGLTQNVLLDWKSVNSANYYEYQLDKTSDFNSSTIITGTKNFINNERDNEDTEFMAEGLEKGTTYFWRVRFVLDDSTYAWSETWSFTTSVDGLGIYEVDAKSINVFPNPTDNVLNINAYTDIKHISLLDLRGGVCYSSSAQRNFEQFSMKSLPQGIYFLRVITLDGKSTIHRVVMQ